MNFRSIAVVLRMLVEPWRPVPPTLPDGTPVADLLDTVVGALATTPESWAAQATRQTVERYVPLMASCARPTPLPPFDPTPDFRVIAPDDVVMRGWYAEDDDARVVVLADAGMRPVLGRWRVRMPAGETIVDIRRTSTRRIAVTCIDPDGHRHDDWMVAESMPRSVDYWLGQITAPMPWPQVWAVMLAACTRPGEGPVRILHHARSSSGDGRVPVDPLAPVLYPGFDRALRRVADRDTFSVTDRTVALGLRLWLRREGATVAEPPVDAATLDRLWPPRRRVSSLRRVLHRPSSIDVDTDDDHDELVRLTMSAISAVRGLEPWRFRLGPWHGLWFPPPEDTSMDHPPMSRLPILLPSAAVCALQENHVLRLFVQDGTHAWLCGDAAVIRQPGWRQPWVFCRGEVSRVVPLLAAAGADHEIALMGDVHRLAPALRALGFVPHPCRNGPYWPAEVLIASLAGDPACRACAPWLVLTASQPV